MSFFGYDNGYTRGGRDVESSVNLFFKGILLFPVFIMAIYIGLAMMKNMLFMGVPTMTQPTNEQREKIRQRDQNTIPSEPVAPSYVHTAPTSPKAVSVRNENSAPAVNSTIAIENAVYKKEIEQQEQIARSYDQCVANINTLIKNNPSFTGTSEYMMMNNTCEQIRRS